MIPLALDLRNFMSYGPDWQRLDFGALESLACLCGENGAGKCLPGWVRVYDPDAGEAVPIARFVAERRSRILGLVRGQIVPVTVTDWHTLGERPTAWMRLRNGVAWEAATTHPILTNRGCVPIEQLTPEDAIAEPLGVPSFGKDLIDSHRAEQLGRDVGILGFGEALGPENEEQIARSTDLLLLASEETIIAFLSGLWLTIGTAWARETPSLSFTTASSALLSVVRFLLNRLGISSHIERGAGPAGRVFVDNESIPYALARLPWAREELSAIDAESDDDGLTKEFDWTRVERVELTGRSVPCFDVTVATVEHVYLADTFLVHNSSLLDAITWVLWDTSRAPSVADLVHGEANDMEVRFTFALDDQRYRAIRRYQRPAGGRANGHTSLIFQIQDGEEWRVISENSLRETQAFIDRTLRLSATTFLSSAYFAQGRSGEFSRSDPAMRKEILAEVLGLSVYDDLLEPTKEQARAADLERQSSQRLLETIDEFLAGEAALQARLGELESSRTAAQQALESTDAEVERLQALQTTIQEQLAARNILAEQLLTQNDDLDRLRTRVAGLSLTREQQSLCAAEEEITRAVGEADRLRLELAKLDEVAELARAAHERQRDLSAQLQRARAERLKEAERQNRLLGQARQRLNAEESLAGKLPSLKTRYDELTRLRGDLESARAATHQLTASVKSADAELVRLEREGITLNQEHTHLVDGGHCPVCDSELGGHRAADIRARMEERLQQTREDYARVKTKLATDRRLLQETERKVEQLNSRQTALFGVEEEYARVTAAAERAEQLRQEFDQLTHEAQELDRNAESEVQRLEGCVAESSTELLAIGYNAAAHADLREALEVARRHSERAPLLMAALAARDELDRRRAEYREDIAQREAAVRELQIQLANLDRAISTLGDPRQAIQVARDAVNRRREEVARVDRELGGCRTQIAECAEQRRRRADVEQTLAAWSTRHQLLSELVQAFGKKGVPAMIIESVLPELEREANLILERLSAGRQRLRFLSQRTTRSGKTVETLDIEISDPEGTRLYALYSGGEALRIDFAIRVALSRLLTRRNGARLQFLIIDEGFGSQDTENRFRLVEALRAIRHDFQQIIVVTHLSEISELFPSRIEVRKQETGSRIFTVNHGADQAAVAVA